LISIFLYSFDSSFFTLSKSVEKLLVYLELTEKYSSEWKTRGKKIEKSIRVDKVSRLDTYIIDVAKKAVYTVL